MVLAESSGMLFCLIDPRVIEVRLSSFLYVNLAIGGRNGFDGIESRWEGVPGSELPLNDRKNIIANQQFAYAA